MLKTGVLWKDLYKKTKQLSKFVFMFIILRLDVAIGSEVRILCVFEGLSHHLMLCV